MSNHSSSDQHALQAAIDQYAQQAGPEPALPQLALGALLPDLHASVRVEPNPTLLGRTRYERIWVVINRLIRRVIRHAAEPAVQQQNTLNQSLQVALEDMIMLDSALHATMVRIRAESRHESS